MTDDQVYQEMEKEIDKIQASMSSLGPVNLESLQELESLEERLETLKKQHVDLALNSNERSSGKRVGKVRLNTFETRWNVPQRVSRSTCGGLAVCLDGSPDVFVFLPNPMRDQALRWGTKIRKNNFHATPAYKLHATLRSSGTPKARWRFRAAGPLDIYI